MTTSRKRTDMADGLQTRPGMPGRSSAACCCAATSPSTPRPPSSSPTPSRPHSAPVRPPGRRASAGVFPPLTAPPCSDRAGAGDAGTGPQRGGEPAGSRIPHLQIVMHRLWPRLRHPGCGALMGLAGRGRGRAGGGRAYQAARQDDRHHSGVGNCQVPEVPGGGHAARVAAERRRSECRPGPEPEQPVRGPWFVLGMLPGVPDRRQVQDRVGDDADRDGQPRVAGGRQ